MGNYRCLRIILIIFVSASVLFVSGFWGEVSADSELLKQAFATGDDITVVRAKIASNGYNFKVSNNWVVELPQNLRDRMRFRRNPSLLIRNLKEKVLSDPLEPFLNQPLPSSYDLRNVGSPGRSYIGPVRQQGSCGACYAFGACAAAEGSYNLATGCCDQNCVDFSEAFITFCLDPLYAGFDGCRGANYEYEELEALVKYGVCYEKQLPYNSAHRSCPLSLDLPTVHFTSWHRLPCNDTDAIKAAIYHFGVVDVAVATNAAFDAYASGIYEDARSDCVDPKSGICYYAPTDHVAALVGWDDNDGEGFWILRNSWGSEWGESGYMRIKYNSAHVACAACYLTFTAKKTRLPPSRPKSVVVPWLKLLLDD